MPIPQHMLSRYLSALQQAQSAAAAKLAGLFTPSPDPLTQAGAGWSRTDQNALLGGTLPVEAPGQRPDGSLKGAGWLGSMGRPDGRSATEITAGVNLDGKETNIPLMVPGLSNDELSYLLSASPESPDFYKQMPGTILPKAIAHARSRMAEGRSPYIDEAPTIDRATQEMFGLQPGMDRLNLLPRHDPEQGWVAPEIVNQLARASVMPGVAAQGGDVSPEDAMNFAGNLAGASLGVSAIRPVPGKGVLGQTVFHGSPHVFDEFDISKIGTGEGAQAYGHGLYAADREQVASAYQPGQWKKSYTHRGEPLSVLQGKMENAGRYEEAGVLESIQLHRTREQILALLEPDQKVAADYVKSLPKTLFAKPKGGLYHVDLPDEHIAKMLDWDKPLSQQSPAVQKAFQDAYEDRPAWNKSNSYTSANGSAKMYPAHGAIDGSGIYELLSKTYGGQDKASEVLRNAGIPGIKYLDGGSRAAGDGTRNYVVFDDKLLKILKRE
jgi:hypothetical protein